MGKLNVDGTEIQVLQIEEDDYISLTDMVRKEIMLEADVLNMALFGMTAKQWRDRILIKMVISVITQK